MPLIYSLSKHGKSHTKFEKMKKFQLVEFLLLLPLCGRQKIHLKRGSVNYVLVLERGGVPYEKIKEIIVRMF